VYDIGSGSVLADIHHDFASRRFQFEFFHEVESSLFVLGVQMCFKLSDSLSSPCSAVLACIWHTFSLIHWFHEVLFQMRSI
jgi:hypothetical protein